MTQETSEPSVVVKCLVVAGCTLIIASIVWVIVLEQSGSPSTPPPPAPSAFHPAHWRPEELEAEIGHPGFLSAIAGATKGTVCRLSDDRKETGPVRSLLQSDMSLLRQVLSNHLSYGIPYASIPEPVYVLRLQGPDGEEEIIVDAEGMELCVSRIDGQDFGKWYACSKEAMLLLNSIGRRHLRIR